MKNDYNYFSDTEISEEVRRDYAFQVVNGIRESYTLAKNVNTSISYEHAFRIIHDLKPELYEAVINLLVNKNESEDVKLFKEKAEALSDVDDNISPIDLINKEMEEIDSMLTKSKNKSSNSTYLYKRKFELTAAKEYFTPRKVSEHKSLNHDFYLRARDEFFGKPLYENDDFRDYKINKDKVLRLRLLHPDKAEAILGVDLIYEHFDLQLNRVRFAHMQYKAWDNKSLYESSTSNLKDQILKMKSNLCEQGYCKGPENKKKSGYRFPHCSGFLRPTSKLQHSESKLISTGLHIPICQALKLFQEDGKINKDNSKDKSIKGHIFEELFISNIAGSRWIKIDELEKFYTEKNIISYTNRIRIHAQEVDLFDESKKNKDREVF